MAFANASSTRNQFGGSVGGPLQRDRAFFFVNYDGMRRTQETSVVPLLKKAPGTEDLYLPA